MNSPKPTPVARLTVAAPTPKAIKDRGVSRHVAMNTKIGDRIDPMLAQVLRAVAK